MSDLRLDGGTQFRVQLAWAHIGEIAEQLKKDEQARAVNPDAKPMVPAVDVFWAHGNRVRPACRIVGRRHPVRGPVQRSAWA